LNFIGNQPSLLIAIYESGMEILPDSFISWRVIMQCFLQFLRDNWEHLGSYAIAIVGLFGGMIALRTYLSTIYWNFYRYLADRHLEILRLAIQKPDFMNPEKTKRYTEEWPLGHNDRAAYEAYATLCWSHARDIYSARFLLILWRRRFRKIYANSLEVYRQIHRKWLDNNVAFFPDKKFLSFINKCRWREYFDSRTADLLHWNNEADDFDEKILHPLRVETDNILLNYVNEISGANLIVADAGCGNGKFLMILAKKSPPFNEIYGLDYSDRMVEIAKENCKDFPSIRVVKVDLTDLSNFYNSFDYVFSLNSILPRDGNDTRLMMQEIAKSLKIGGKFVAILPAFDTVKHLKKIELCLIKRMYKGNLPEPMKSIVGHLKAWCEVRRNFYIEKRMSRWNWIKPFGRKYRYADDGVNIQRFIEAREIPGLIQECGLSLEKQCKLYYPWKIATKYHYGHLTPEQYRDLEMIWDWFVVAEKPKVELNSKN
jgi:SAM-dependent methyltransferase